MKIIKEYLHGLHELLRSIGNPDPDIGVIGLVGLFEMLLLVDISIIFNFRMPLTSDLGNKWVVRAIGGILLILINKYVFGIRESSYSEYTPLSKRSTFLITILCFAITLGFLFYSSKNR